MEIEMSEKPIAVKPLPVEPSPEMAGNEPAAWIVTNPQTGNVILWTFDRGNAADVHANYEGSKIEPLYSASTLARLERERDEARAERDELDALYHEGGTLEEQLAAAEAERDEAREQLRLADEQNDKLGSIVDANIGWDNGPSKLALAMAALKALVEKLDEIIGHPAYRAVFEAAFLHGVTYEGPNFESELEAARAALGASDEAQ